jgi:hypothetical protein
MKKTLVLSLILLLSSCSANWHIKRAIKKDASILKSTTYLIDTMLVTDSFAFLDTFYAKSIDTFVAESGPCKTTIYKYNERIIVDQQVRRDTIRFKETITLPPQVVYTEKKPKWYWLAILVLIGVIVGVLIKK